MKPNHDKIYVAYPPEGERFFWVQEACTEQARREAGALRWREYVVKLKSLLEENYLDKQEFDSHDATAILFVAYYLLSGQPQMTGTFRVIPQHGAFLLEEGPDGFVLPAHLQSLRGDPKTCELSRIVGPRLPHGEEKIIQWIYLYIAVAIWSLEHGFDCWIFGILAPFYDKMMQDGWPLESFGYKERYHGHPAHAVTVNLARLAEFLTRRYPSFFPLEYHRF